VEQEKNKEEKNKKEKNKKEKNKKIIKEREKEENKGKDKEKEEDIRIPFIKKLSYPLAPSKDTGRKFLRFKEILK